MQVSLIVSYCFGSYTGADPGGGGGGGGGVEWVSSHPPTSLKCRQEQFLQHEEQALKTVHTV